MNIDSLWRWHDGVQLPSGPVDVLTCFPIHPERDTPSPLLKQLIALGETVLANPSASPDASPKLAGQLRQQREL
ncbi:MAG: hypothetical protein CM15mP77_0160 [Synechococcus sp.]|nr:MAG: hypothetical protein CM15mP77_0160 [Synechococcus sp.]